MLPVYYTPSGLGSHGDQWSAVRFAKSGFGGQWGGRNRGNLAPISKKGQRVVQPSLVRTGPHTFKAFMRDRRAKFVHVSDSTDDGRTWSEPRPTTLPNNNKSIQAATLPNGDIAIVFGNNSGQMYWPMSIALSSDGGETWTHGTWSVDNVRGGGGEAGTDTARCGKNRSPGP